MGGLLHTLKELQGTIISVKNDLNSLNETVSKLSVTVNNMEENQSQLSAKIDTLDSKLDSVNAKIFNDVMSQLEEYKQQTASELVGLQSNMTAGLAGLHTSLKGDLSSLNDSTNRISDNVEAHDNHVTTELMELDQNLQQNFTLLLKNSYGYSHTCGGTRGWRRVVYLNFTDPNTPCPSGWQRTNHSKRTCGRVSTSRLTCDSVTFPVSGGDYTRVCGRNIGIQMHFGPIITM